jgi:hypothetical protein
MFLKSVLISHAVALAVVLAGADPARSAVGCAFDQAATVTARIADIYEFGKEKDQWALDLAEAKGITCEVETIFTYDAPPAGCTTGATVTATGLEEDDGDAVPLGSLTALACTP